MPQEPQQPEIGPEGQSPQPGQSPPPPPPLPPQQPQQAQWGQPQQSQQPQWGQYAQPQQAQWGQYAQPQQAQWGQYAQPQYGQPQYSQQGYPGQPGMAPGFNNYLPPPKPGVIPLRPLGLGEILDGAFQAARRNGKAMFGSALIFQLATVAVTMAVMFIIFGRFMTDVFDMESGLQSNDPAAMEALGGGLLTFSLSMLLTGFLAVLIQMVLQGALVVPVLRSVLNRKTSFGQMWRLTKPRVGSLILLAVLYAVATLVAVAAFAAIVVALIVALDPQESGSAILGVIALSLLLSLPFVALAVWIGTKVLLAPAAIVVENVGAIAGIKRSWQLTKRNWWRTFGTSFLAALIAGIIGAVITTPVSMLVSFVMPLMLGSEPTPDQTITVLLISQGLTSIVSAVVGAVTLAFQTGVMALIYVDLRMRRDGFDIALLKESETGKDDGGIPGSPVPGALVSEDFASYGNTTYGNSSGTTGVETHYQPGNYGS